MAGSVYDHRAVRSVLKPVCAAFEMSPGRIAAE